MATSNLNKIIIYNKKNKARCCHCVKEKLEQFYRPCSGIAIFFKKLTLFYPKVVITKIS